MKGKESKNEHSNHALVNDEDPITNHPMHHGKKHECQKCEFVISDENQLMTHNQLEHEISTVDIQAGDPVAIYCDKCEYRCHLNIQLRNHMKQHHNDQWKYLCEKCDFGTELVA